MAPSATTPDCLTVARPSARTVRSGTQRREVPRFRWAVPLRLTRTGRADGRVCRSCDFGAGGLFLEVPQSWGLAVGERRILDGGEAPDARALAGETHYATVIRTTPGADRAEMGAGLRFDRPLCL